MKRFGVIGIALIVMLASGQAWSAPAVTNYPRSISLSPITFQAGAPGLDANDVFAAVNESRRQSGLPPLRPNQQLAEVAQQRALDMAVRQYYAHRSPDGKYYYDYFPAQGINPSYSCENLELMYAPDKNTAVTDWLQSHKGHRQCLLHKDIVEAGYATTQLNVSAENGATTTVYVVVAIHATSS